MSPSGAGSSIEAMMLRDVLAAYREAITKDDASSERFVLSIERWMRGEGVFGVFAFDRVCRTVGVEARRLRRELSALRARHTSMWQQRATG